MNDHVNERVLPVVDDPETAGFFAAAAAGELAIKHCCGCDCVLHPPTDYCRFCGSRDTQWRAVEPLGTVYSWTVAVHPVHAGFPVPYTVALVDVDAAAPARLLAYLPGRVELHPGQKMEAWFEELQDGTVIVQWRPLDASSTSAT